MRSHLSQTVKNVLRKGKGSRSRKSSFRDMGEEYGDGDSNRSFNEETSSRRFHRGRRSSENSENSSTFWREGSMMSRWRGRSSRRYKSQVGENNPQSQMEPNRRHRSLWHHNSRGNLNSNWETKNVDGSRNGSPSPRDYDQMSTASTYYGPTPETYRPGPNLQSASPVATPTPTPVTRRTLQSSSRYMTDGSPAPSRRLTPVPHSASTIHRPPTSHSQVYPAYSPEQSSRASRASPLPHRLQPVSSINPAMADDVCRNAPRTCTTVRLPQSQGDLRRGEEMEAPSPATEHETGVVSSRRMPIGGQSNSARVTPRRATRQTSYSGSTYQSAQDYPATDCGEIVLSACQNLVSAYTRFGTPTDLTKFFFPDEWVPSRFRSIRKIASAIHGEVRCARDQLDGNKEVVVKVIRNAAVRPREPGELENPLVEIGAMTYLHSNKALYPVDLVARMLGVYQDSKYTYLVSEHCSGGELFREVVARKCFHERLVKAVALQLALALLSLHKNGICHRDVSLENTLLAGDRTVRLIDFGQAECIYNADGSERWLTGSAGKDYYRAPEMTRGPYIGPPVDVFALGVEIFIMAIGSPPWNEATPNDARYRSLTSRVDALDIAFRKWGKRSMLSNAFVDLVSGIFCADPKDRPTIEELLLHPWFSHDLGIWQWVANRGHSVTIAQQKERVFAYLRDVDPRGKFFYRPCGSAVSTYSALSTNTLTASRDLGASGSTVAAHDRAAAARHRRPHA